MTLGRRGGYGCRPVGVLWARERAAARPRGFLSPPKPGGWHLVMDH